MKNQIVYRVSHGDGLKDHLSLDSDGNKSLCGKALNKLPKKVTRSEVKNPLLIAIICHKCLKVYGVI